MTTGYQKILLAIDGTDEADQVLRAGTELAPRQLDRFHVISVIPPVAAGAGGVDGLSFAASWPLQELESHIVRELSANVRERIARFGIAPDQTAISFGRPAAEIRAYAEKIGADLIVVGSHGRTGISGLLGSTARGVLHGAPCDVLVVRVAVRRTISPS